MCVCVSLVDRHVERIATGMQGASNSPLNVDTTACNSGFKHANLAIRLPLAPTLAFMLQQQSRSLALCDFRLEGPCNRTYGKHPKKAPPSHGSNKGYATHPQLALGCSDTTSNFLALSAKSGGPGVLLLALRNSLKTGSLQNGSVPVGLPKPNPPQTRPCLNQRRPMAKRRAESTWKTLTLHRKPGR